MCDTEKVGALLSILHEQSVGENEAGVQDVIFELGAIMLGYSEVPDVIVEKIIQLLGERRIARSCVAGHLLNFFEFQSTFLTGNQKASIKDFLSRNIESFSTVHSAQVASELLNKEYLK